LNYVRLPSGFIRPSRLTLDPIIIHTTTGLQVEHSDVCGLGGGSNFSAKMIFAGVVGSIGGWTDAIG
jgi:hypothetical protein